MEITVNGKSQKLTDKEILLLELIRQNNVTQPEMVSVQLNGNFVNREDFHRTVIKSNDEVDFLYFMGGGQRC
jgi:sulfur carrier protein